MRTAHTIYTCSLIKIFIRAMHYYGAYVKSGSRLPPPLKEVTLVTRIVDIDLKLCKFSK